MSVPKNNHSINSDGNHDLKSDSNSTDLRRPKPIPFLELSLSTISALDQNSIDFENVLSVWTGLTKSSSYVRNGKRLENISWRVINRNLVNNGSKSLKLNANDFNTLINISSSKYVQQPFIDEIRNNNDHSHTHSQHTNSSITSKKKKQNSQRHVSQESLLNNKKGSLTSLHKLHVTDHQSSNNNNIINNNNNNNSHNNSNTSKQENLSQQQQFPKRPVNPRQVSEISIQNVGTEITEEVSSSEDEDNVAESYTKKRITTNENNHNINKNNKIKYNIDYDDDDDELEFRQPEPKFVSELFRKSHSSLSIEDDDKEKDLKNLELINQELQNQKPPMMRSNTSTSIVRGFSPSQLSISYINVQDLQKKVPKDELTEKVSSLFSNKCGSSSLEDVEEEHPSAPSLFQKSNGNSAPKTASLFGNKPSKKDDERLPTVSSLFGNKTREDDEKLPAVSSLFGNKTSEKDDKPPTVSSLFAINNIGKDERPPTVSSLFAANSNNNQTEKLPSVSSLFTGSKQDKQELLPISSLFDNKKRLLRTQTLLSASPLSNDVKEATTTITLKSLDQNPSHYNQHQQHHYPQLHHTSGKKQNLLNNLGMTSLHNVTSEPSRDPNNMFFIESSPSPAESDIVGSIDNITLNDHLSQGNVNNHHHNNAVRSISKSKQNYDQLHGNSITHPNHHSEEHGIGKGDGESTIVKQLDSLNEKSNTSLFQHQNNLKNNQLIYSSDSYSDDSDWSSVSADSDSGSDDAEYNRQRWKEESLKFSKKEENTKPQIKRSLLSGLFLNEMNTDEVHHHHQDGKKKPLDGKKSTLLRSSTTGDVHNIGNSFSWNNNSSKGHHQQHVIESKSSLEVASSFKNHRKAPSVTPSETTFNASASVTFPQSQMKPTLERQTSTSSVLSNHSTQYHHHQPNLYGSSVDKKSQQQQQQPSLTRLMSQSALNLTSYFVNSRRPSSHQTHQSNAPPTAATLLPTALATHMFLPNVHQRARSKLSSVVEASPATTFSSVTSSNGTELRESTTTETIKSQKSQANQRKPSLPTLIPVKSRTSSFVSMNGSSSSRPKNLLNNGAFTTTTANVSNNNNNNQVIPGEKLSPRLSRKLMLATELSESLRASMLWDRKLTNVKLNDGYDRPPVHKKREAVEIPDLDNSSISDIEEIDKKNLLHEEKKGLDGEPTEWNDDDDELDYHAKGW